MSLIRPFAALRPKSEYAADVIAPPYDVLNTEEARLRAAGKPWSFLHISKPEIDLPPETDPHSDAVYAKGTENLQKMLTAGILKQDDQEHYYLYRLIMGQHQQIGLVAVANVEDYNRNRIRKHELTRPEKEDDRVHHMEALNAQTGPVFLSYKQNPVINTLVETVIQQPPEVNLTADDGIQHSLWVVDNPKDIESITQTFEAMPCIYIADGHHRSAAASRVAKKRDATSPAAYFLTVIFPDDQMQILDYNRVVKDLNGLSPTDFLTRVTQNFDVTSSETAAKPQKSGTFGMYLDGHWYYLQCKTISSDDPVTGLDVSVLTTELLDPILGIRNLRRDTRIDFVGGMRGLGELEKRVNSGEMAVAFALYPITMPALMAVADAGKQMPPKTTWFEPKLADGLVSHLL